MVVYVALLMEMFGSLEDPLRLTIWIGNRCGMKCIQIYGLLSVECSGKWLST